MNPSLIVFLINKDVRCVGVSYEPDGATPPGGKQIRLFKTMDAAMRPNDLVVMPTDTRWGMTVGRVETVDVDVDFDASTKMEWLVQAVDKTTFDKMLAVEETAIQTVRKAEIRRKREELARDLLADNPDLQALGEAVGPALSPPPPPS